MATLKLSGFLGGISGRAGNAVYRLTLNGTELSDRPVVNNPSTPAQQSVRAAFTKATRGWRQLNATQATAWNNYAKQIRERNDVSGNEVSRTGFNWYTALSSRFYLVNGLSGTAPSTPPTTSYNGDNLQFSIGSRPGLLVIEASGANSSGTKTVLLAQRLRSATAKPQRGAYRTLGYQAFTSGSLEAQVPVAPGTYAVAVQYVNIATGQETELEPLGVVGPVTLALKKVA